MIIRFLVVTTCILSMAACSGRQSLLMQAEVKKADTAAAKKADALVKEANALWNARGDEAKALAAIAKWNEAAKLDGARSDIHRDLAYAYYFMNNVHVRWSEADDKKKVEEANYLKGVDAAERALMTANPAFAKQIKAGDNTDDAWNEALKSATKEDVKALYWYAANLAKWALAHHFTTILKFKDRAYAIMQRCKALDNAFWYGGPSRYLGAYWLKIPFGKSKEKSKDNFDKALAAAPAYLDTKIIYAEIYAVRTDDEALFKKLLDEVIATADDVDANLVPENKNAKRLAKKMLEDMDEFF
ncbi:MAG: TRAP transporter TatT component family protein [Myxococcota bacterium]|nr:TRAP transporter TatT component family protein [Myxococcota bacterium]